MLARDQRLHFLQLRRGLREFALRGVEIRSRNGPLFDQVALPLDLGSGERESRLRRAELRLLLLRIQLHEERAFFHRCARFKRDLRDDPRKIGADRDALHGPQRTNRAEDRLPRLRLNRDRRHRGRRRRKLLPHRHAREDGSVFHKSDERDRGDHQTEHQQHSFPHK